MLMLWEEVEEDRKRFDDRFTALRANLAVVPTDQIDYVNIKRLFPEFFPEPKKEEIVIYEVSEEELVDTTGEWRFDKSETAMDEIEAVLQSLGQSSRITLTPADEVDDGGWI